MANILKGRPRKHSEFEALLVSLPKPMTKRPKYVKGIGIFRGARGDTAWIKIRLRQPTDYKGKRHAAGDSLEIKVGNLESWSWDQLLRQHAELQGKADRGEPLEDAKQVLFSGFAEGWLERAKVRLRGYETDQIQVNRHLMPFFGSFALDLIATKDINLWIAHRLKTAAPSSVKRGLGTLSSMLGDAKRSGYIETNPCIDANTIRGIVGRQRFLSMEELVGLLAAAETTAEWLPDFITWGVHSGMRKSEILNLVWTEVQDLPDGRKIASVTTSKADQPRMIICTQTMTEVLERQKGRMQQGKKAVFPVSRMTLRRKWEKARKLVDLEDVTMHDLRRTHSTHAAAAGVDLRTLAGRIGHADLTMLQKHYAAIVGTAAVEAADTIEEIFSQHGK